jgi:hypothetical protein
MVRHTTSTGASITISRSIWYSVVPTSTSLPVHVSYLVARSVSSTRW